MVEHKVVTTDAEIDAALMRAKRLSHEPVARSVEYIPTFHLLLVVLSNRQRLALPVESLQGLGKATRKQLANYELLGRGTGIRFPELDVDLYVPALIEGVFGNRRWMAQLGRKGGKAKTPAKRMAARANGVKGGRPRRVAA